MSNTEFNTTRDIAGGGIIGAVGGGIIGAMAGGPIGAVIGAVIGGAASAGATSVVDKRDRDDTGADAFAGGNDLVEDYQNPYAGGYQGNPTPIHGAVPLVIASPIPVIVDDIATDDIPEAPPTPIHMAALGGGEGRGAVIDPKDSPDETVAPPWAE